MNDENYNLLIRLQLDGVWFILYKTFLILINREFAYECFDPLR